MTISPLGSTKAFITKGQTRQASPRSLQARVIALANVVPAGGKIPTTPLIGTPLHDATTRLGTCQTGFRAPYGTFETGKGTSHAQDAVT